MKLNLRYVFSRQLTIKGSYMGTRAELVKVAELMGQGRVDLGDRPYVSTSGGSRGAGADVE